MRICIYALAVFTCVICDRLELPAYEYIRRFKHPLFLGQCADRVVQYPEGPIPEQCTFPNRQGETTRRFKEVDVRKVIPVRDASELIHNIGMCDDQSAAYFGLLASGDCIVNEIAKKLSFKNKVTTLMYMEHFRPRLNILMPSAELNNIPSEFTHYLNNSYYTENISIGTEEIIIAELHFQTPEEGKKAYNDRFLTDKLSETLMNIAKVVGLPNKVKVVRLSTSDNVFKMNVFNTEMSALFEAIQSIDQYEKQIIRTRYELQHGMRTSHLRYGFKAYEIGPIAYALTTVTDTERKHRWEQVALLQINAERVFLTYRRYRKTCRSFESTNKYCLLMIQTLKELKKTVTVIHTQRRDWSNIKEPQVQELFIREESKKVKLLKSRANMLAKTIKKLTKKKS